jgi:hypothetical protein
MIAAAAPRMAGQLEAVYGTGYAGFATLDEIDNIMAERTRHFFGRDDQLAILDAFVASNPRGIMMIVAPGGFGKSALLANWGPRQAARGAAVAYHFFSATALRRTERTDALKGLLIQLAFLSKRPAPRLPDDPSKLQKMLSKELCRDAHPDRPVILILDSLNEAADERLPLFGIPEKLGQHVYIVASGVSVHNVYILNPWSIEPAARALEPKYLTEWLRGAKRYDFPVLCHDVPQLSREGVLAWLRGLVPDIPADQEARLVQCLAATSEGVPLFFQLIIDDIRDRLVQGESLVAIIASLDALPASFTEYAARRLRSIGEMQRQTAGACDVDIARIFALLTVVKGTLPLDDLRQVLQTSADPQAFDPRITRWFARGAYGERTIAFLHPRLAVVFRAILAGDMLAEVEGRLVAHCGSHWSKGSLYALTYLPQHQIEAGQIADAFATLTDLAFLDARLTHEAAPALIERSYEELRATDEAAPPELRAETSLHRSFWEDIRGHLLRAVVRGPQRDHARDVLRQLLHDNPVMAERYATGNPAWVQIAGHFTPPWWRITPKPPQERIGHSMWIWGARALSDGRLLSWSDDKTLRLWASDGAPLAEMKGHGAAVRGAAELKDGRLLSWSDDGTLRLWASDGMALAELKGHASQAWIGGATELGDGRLLSWEDTTLRLWTSDGAPLAEMKGHGNSVYGAAELKDGRLLSWSGDKTFRLWTSDGTALVELGSRVLVKGAIELEGGRLLSWTVSGTLLLWGADGTALTEIKGHGDTLYGAAELKDGRLLSWSADGTLRLWASDGTALTEMKGHGDAVYGAAELKDGRLLSWSGDETLRLWARNGAALAELKGHSGRILGATVLSDGRLLSWSSDNTLRLWACDGAFQSLWLWPHGEMNAVIPHTDRPGTFWVIATGHVLQVRHQPVSATAVQC